MNELNEEVAPYISPHSWSERVLAQFGWLAALLILGLWVFSAELSHKFDWLRWGSDYEASQVKLVERTQAVITQLDGRLKALEKPAGKAE